MQLYVLNVTKMGIHILNNVERNTRDHLHNAMEFFRVHHFPRNQSLAHRWDKYSQYYIVVQQFTNPNVEEE